MLFLLSNLTCRGRPYPPSHSPLGAASLRINLQKRVTLAPSTSFSKLTTAPHGLRQAKIIIGRRPSSVHYAQPIESSRHKGRDRPREFQLKHKSPPVHPRQPFRDSRQKTHPLLQSPGCTNRPRFQPHTTGGSTALNSDSSFQSARARSLCDQSETIAPYPPSLNRFFGEACSKACASSKISPIRAAKR